MGRFGTKNPARGWATRRARYGPNGSRQLAGYQIACACDWGARAGTRRGSRCGGSEMVYLLHFERPYHHARHYLGFTEDLDTRLEAHRTGDPHTHHRLMQVVAAAGIGFVLARTWNTEDRAFERRLKRWKCAPRLCPICSGERALRWAP